VKQQVYDYDEYDKGLCSLLKKQETYEIDDRNIEYAVGRQRWEGQGASSSEK